MSVDKEADNIRRLAVIGAGSWGTALAWYLAGRGLEIDLWVYEEQVCEQISSRRENRMYLPGIEIPESVRPSLDPGAVVRGHEIVLLVTPSHVMRGILDRVKDDLAPGVSLVSAAKGIENETLMTMSQVMEDVLPERLVVHKAALSGPSFAKEVSRGLPTAVTLACHDRKISERLQRVFSSPAMRVYTSQDLIGVELGGALKNVIAIAAGALDGLNLGLNARAAFITRGLAEITRLGVQMGANPLTFSGLAGMGDLVLTCTSDLSRNRTVGFKLGQGLKIAQILEEMNMVAEGVKTTRSVNDLAEREGVEMPITREVYNVLYRDKDIGRAILDILSRKLKPELD